MSLTSMLCLGFAIVAQPAASVQVQTTAGDAISGRLIKVDNGAIRMERENDAGDVERIPFSQIGNITFDSSPKESGTKARLLLVDGSELLLDDFQTASDNVTGTWGGDRSFVTAIDAAAGVLFTPLSSSELNRWREETLSERESDALLVERNGRILTLDGIVGDIGPDSVTFILDGETIPVNRDRLRSLRYAYRPAGSEPVAVIDDVHGNRWNATEMEWTAQGVRIGLFDVSAELPLAELLRIDFAAARVTFLSDIEPTLLQHFPFFDEPWEMHRDENFQGKPLFIVDVPYEKGLAVHSKTLLEYRVPERASRFEASVGIDRHAGPYGDAVVRARADSRVIFETRVRAGEPPVPVSLPLDDVETLQLEVDYGEFLDLGDWVIWGDARFVR